MDTIGSGLSVVSLVTIVKVVEGVQTKSGSADSAVVFPSLPNCKFETWLKLFERYMYF